MLLGGGPYRLEIALEMAQAQQPAHAGQLRLGLGRQHLTLGVLDRPVHVAPAAGQQRRAQLKHALGADEQQPAALVRRGDGRHLRHDALELLRRHAAEVELALDAHGDAPLLHRRDELEGHHLELDRVERGDQLARRLLRDAVGRLVHGGHRGGHRTHVAVAPRRAHVAHERAGADELLKARSLGVDEGQCVRHSRTTGRGGGEWRAGKSP